MLVLYDRKICKGEYKLGRVTKVHPDCNGIVRTVTIGFRKTDVREPLLPYVPKVLDEVTVGVQRVCVICPVEEKRLGGGKEDGAEVTVSDDDKKMSFGSKIVM